MDAPRQIDRYELRGLLGKGAMGSVYRAWDPKLQREVALKLVARDAKTKPKMQERFHREARAIAALRNPNIVEIYDYAGEDAEMLYLVMELLDGRDLFNIINEHGPVPESIACAVGYELSLALSVAHDGGIIHRDLKPENVLLDKNGRVVLTDFGVVKVISEDSAIGEFNASTEVIGTPGFMAPELLMAKELGPYTDIFSLGALLYNIATGEMPFGGDSPIAVHKAIMNGHYTDPRRYERTLSEAFCACLHRCLEVHPPMRPQTADAVREILKNILESQGVTDWRNDLRDYVRDPKLHGMNARSREAKYTKKLLTYAERENDENRAIQLRRRFEMLTGEAPPARKRDPKAAVPTAVEMRPMRGSQRERSRRNALLFYGGTGLMVALALGLAIYFSVRPSSPAGNLPPLRDSAVTQTLPTPQQPISDKPPARDTGVVRFRVKGKTTILLDGDRLSPGDLRGKRVDAGQHTVEVVMGQKHLTSVIQVSPNGTVNVLVDVKHNRLISR